jgi:hypothetical protein
MAWTTPGTATAGEVLTASFWNTQVRDNMVELAPYFASWTTWTPTITQNGTRTATVNYARYVKIGRIVHGVLNVTITQAGSAGNLIYSSIPIGTPVTIGEAPLGSFVYARTTNIRYAGTLVLFSGVNLLPQVSGTTNALGADPNFATANGDTFTARFQYETTS